MTCLWDGLMRSVAASYAHCLFACHSICGQPADVGGQPWFVWGVFLWGLCLCSDRSGYQDIVTNAKMPRHSVQMVLAYQTLTVGE